jgi:hypothetical protein
MMYYFIPKQAGRPVYSYRLSVVHFWALISIYMWAGPHHLIYTSLPDWVQSLGMVFSLMLIAPSWGGMINGIMTLSGAWHKLRTDPILKFMIVSLSFYGMSTFEGPMMSIKSVNALSHYTDWTIGHVHSGALGWVAMISVGCLYALIPRLYGRAAMYSTKAIDVHFWTTTIGIVLYVASMWIAGVMQGLMWRATNVDGTLTYTFVESLKATYPYYAVRLLGGVLVLGGMFIMAWNVWKTIRGAERRRSTSRCCSRPRPDPDRQRTVRKESMNHEKIEKNVGPARRPGRGRDQHRRPRRDRAAVLHRPGDAAGAGRRALLRAAARGPRRLHPRGLLQLPLADDPPAARRDRALRPLLARRRERVRPSVPVRLEAHGARSRARRRPLLGRVASPAPQQPARRRARIEHAGYPWLATSKVLAAGTAGKMKALRAVGVPYTDEQIAGRRGRGRGPDRAGRADRVPAGPRHGLQDLEEAADERARHGVGGGTRDASSRWWPSSASSRGRGAGSASRTSTRRRGCRSRKTRSGPTAREAVNEQFLERLDRRADGPERRRRAMAAVGHVERASPATKAGAETTGHSWDGDLARVQQPAAALVAVAVLRLGRVRRRLRRALPRARQRTRARSAGRRRDSGRKQHDAADAAYAQRMFERFDTMTVADLQKDADAMRVAKNLFGNNCAMCHGSDGRGAKGFPNLHATNWQWGRTRRPSSRRSPTAASA